MPKIDPEQVRGLEETLENLSKSCQDIAFTSSHISDSLDNLDWLAGCNTRFSVWAWIGACLALFNQGALIAMVIVMVAPIATSVLASRNYK